MKVKTDFSAKQEVFQSKKLPSTIYILDFHPEEAEQGSKMYQCSTKQNKE